MRSLIVATLLASVSGVAWAAGVPCEQLPGLKLPHVEITKSTMIAKGAFAPPSRGMGNPNAGAMYLTLPAFCQVQAISRPTSDSVIGIEVWLPAEGWNGRLEAGGNGGFSSGLEYQSFANGVKKGYAAAGTDTGHQGNDENFAIGHPEKLVDWGYRAVHEMDVTAKAVVAAYYGSAPKYSYFNSCSTGGRQAMVAAEYYPNDFDGIVVGDPANPMTRLQAGSIWSTLAVNKTPESFITADEWAMIKKAVLNECDEKDGLKDGLIEDPRVCKFDIDKLACKNSDAADSNPNDKDPSLRTSDCLNAAQIEAVKKIAEGAKNPRTGEQIYPGWLVGTAMLPSPVADHNPDRSGTTTFRSLFQDPNWDYHTLDLDKDVTRADQLGDSVMNAVDESRLKGLFAHGGKLLMYHGWNDPNITALFSIEYYEKAVAANGGLDKTYDSIRLFMIPGMNHCGGGEGPSTFDKLDVISDWVEKGKAPDQIIASHSNAPGQVDRTRPLCPYPQLAKYKGTGSIDEAANFVCAKP